MIIDIQVLLIFHILTLKLNLNFLHVRLRRRSFYSIGHLLLRSIYLLLRAAHAIIVFPRSHGLYGLAIQNWFAM